MTINFVEVSQAELDAQVVCTRAIQYRYTGRGWQKRNLLTKTKRWRPA